MKLIKKCCWLRTFLAAILIISMAGQSLTAYAATESATSSLKEKHTDPSNTGNNLWSDEGWIVSIQKTENTATGTSSSYAQSDISFENAWLHDFPDEYIDGIYQSPDSYAYIKYGSSVSHKYRVASPTGNSFTDKLVSSYASGKGTNDFETAALLLEENSTTYNNILIGLQTFGEDLDVNMLYNCFSNSSLSAAINSFVGLWKDSGTAATRMNEFVLSDSLDHWQQTVRYLDLLLIVNAMCNYAWNDYIDYYIEHLNQDGSQYFVAIVIAAAANCESVDYGTQALMTLPVYYGYRTGLQPSTFSHWDGSGDFSNIQSTLNNNYAVTWYKMSNGNTNDIWWDRNLAASVYPLGADGSTLGYCGYTYIAPTIQFDPDEIINPPSSSSTSPTSSVAATTTVTPVFTVEATTDDAYMQRDTTQPVTATVTIDMKQTDTVRKYFQMLYNSLNGQSYTTVLEVFIERSFSDSGGTDATTVLDNNLNSFFSNYADQSGSGYPQAAMYRYESTSTDGLFEILEGNEQIQFEDQYLSLANVATGEPMTATYHVGVRMAIYLSGTDPLDYTTASHAWIFQGTGKTVCKGSDVENYCSNTFFVVANTGIFTTQSAHDDAEWICPDGVQWYSSLRDGNWSEVKQGSIYNESYEAMAGVPTDEDLYVGVGYNEFMVNLEGDVKEDSGKTRTYTLTYTVENCIEDDDVNCKRSCPGDHVVTSSHSGTYTEEVDDDGSAYYIDGNLITPTVTVTKQCDSTIYGSCNATSDGPATATGTCLTCGASYSKTITVSDTDCGHAQDGEGCVVDHYVNSAHPHTHVYKFTITQNIAAYDYLDIENLEAWKVDSVVYEMNSALSDDGDITFDPVTAIRAFYTAGSYSSGNGRLAFSTTTDDTGISGYLGNVTQAVGSMSANGVHKSNYLSTVNSKLNDYITSTIDGTYVTVVSDYLDLLNSDGTYQVITGNTYQSNECDIGRIANYTNGGETIASGSGRGPDKTESLGYDTSGVENLTFNPDNKTNMDAPWENADIAEYDLWTRDVMQYSDTYYSEANYATNYKPLNYQSFSFDSYGSFDLYRVGYTGEYDARGSNYETFNSNCNNNVTSSLTSAGDTILNSVQVNDSYSILNLYTALNKLEVNLSGSKTGSSAFTKSGIDINDYYTEKDGSSSNIYRPTVEGDSNSPVVNGEIDTGNVYLYATRVAAQGDPDGVNWATKSDHYYDGVNYNIELTYTKGKDKVNNVVIHNPVAIDVNDVNGDGTIAQVITIDSDYDQRVDSSGVSYTIPSVSLGTCPGDYTCEYKSLISKSEHPLDDNGNIFSPHDDDCYSTISTSSPLHDVSATSTGSTVGAFNTHEHTDACYTNYSKTFTSGSSGDYTLAGGLTYYIEVGGTALTSTQYVNMPGAVVKGFITLPGTINTSEETDTTYTLSYDTGSSSKSTVRDKDSDGNTVTVEPSDSVSVVITNDTTGEAVMSVVPANGYSIYMAYTDEWYSYTDSIDLSSYSGLDNVLVSYDSTGAGYVKIIAVDSSSIAESESKNYTDGYYYATDAPELKYSSDGGTVTEQHTGYIFTSIATASVTINQTVYNLESNIDTYLLYNGNTDTYFSSQSEAEAYFEQNYKSAVYAQLLSNIQSQATSLSTGSVVTIAQGDVSYVTSQSTYTAEVIISDDPVTYKFWYEQTFTCNTDNNTVTYISDVTSVETDSYGQYFAGEASAQAYFEGWYADDVLDDFTEDNAKNKTHIQERTEYTYSSIGTTLATGGVLNYNVDHTIMNKHVCYTKSQAEALGLATYCTSGSTVKVLTCTDPHHYLESYKNSVSGFDPDSEDYYNDGSHHDKDCWVACNDDSNHSSGAGASSSYASFASSYDGSVESRKSSISAVGLDREFTVTFPTEGNFYGNGALGILDCTATPGKGYYDGMSTEQWIRDKYVTFSFDVLIETDSGYDAYEAGTPIPWYTYFQGSNTGTFYCPLENSEQVNGTATFQVIAVNSPTTEGLAKENEYVDNKSRDQYSYAAWHDAYYQQIVDVIGYIGALAIEDVSDPRFAELFKYTTQEIIDAGDWLIPGLVYKVNDAAPKTVVSDQQTAKEDDASSKNYFQDVWQTLTPGQLVYDTNNVDTARSYWPGNSSSVLSSISSLGGKWQTNLSLPLIPDYLSSISNGLAQQAMRIGYDMYMDVQTVGNYYGRNETSTAYQQVVIKPNYYLVVPTGSTDSDGYSYVKTYPLNVYATNSSGKYSLVNSNSELAEAASETNLKGGSVYIDWENESDRRNATYYEAAVTAIGDSLFYDITDDDSDTEASGKSVTTSDKHKQGTTQILNLIDIDKTYVGSQYTNGDGSTTTYMNGIVKDMYAQTATRTDDDGNSTTGYYLWGSSYTIQAQRYHFSISLPSSSKFVLADKDTDHVYSTSENNTYENLASKDGAHIICVLQIEADGQIWALEYSRYSADGGSNQHQTYTYQGYKFKDPVSSEEEDNPIVAVYDPLKTSANDLDTVGTH